MMLAKMKLPRSGRNFSVEGEASAGNEVVISDPLPVHGEALGGEDPGVSAALLTGHQLVLWNMGTTCSGCSKQNS